MSQKVRPIAIEVFNYVKKPVVFSFGVFVALSMMTNFPDYASLGVAGLAGIAYGLSERDAVRLAEVTVSLI